MVIGYPIPNIAWLVTVAPNTPRRVNITSRGRRVSPALGLGFSIAPCPAVSLADQARRCQSQACPPPHSHAPAGGGLSASADLPDRRGIEGAKATSSPVAKTMHETSPCVLATYSVAASTSARAAAWSAPAGGRVRVRVRARAALLARVPSRPRQ